MARDLNDAGRRQPLVKLARRAEHGNEEAADLLIRHLSSGQRTLPIKHVHLMTYTQSFTCIYTIRLLIVILCAFCEDDMKRLLHHISFIGDCYYKVGCNLRTLI